MLVSGEKGFIFIHVQKTGGLSVEDLLKETAPDAQFVGPRHQGAGLASKKVEGFERYFRFAFVRNPFDRLVSWYSMIETARKAHEGEPLPQTRINRLKRNPLLAHAVDVLNEDNSFESFVKNATGEFVQQGAIYSFTRPQLDYLTDGADRYMVDFVGRFERLAEDLSKILSRIGASDAPELEHRNASERTHYRDYYTPETKEIVAERFAKDIEHFGYTF